jgi:hypothetical protein
VIKVQFRDGRTLSFDLDRQSDLNAWCRFSQGEGWKDSVTALAIFCRKTLHTLPVPNADLRPDDLGAGLVIDRKYKRPCGEEIWYCTNGIRITLIVYGGQRKVSKVAVSKQPQCRS